MNYEVGGRPNQLKRPGYPENLVIRFDSTFVDTGQVIGAGRPAKPAKFRIYAVTDTGETRMQFFFRDVNNDGTLDSTGSQGDFVSVLTRPVGATLSAFDFTWRIALASPPTTGGPLRPPGAGDVFRIKLKIPFEPGEAFSFSTTAETAAPGGTAGKSQPYVVPNPYLGAASFEPAPFNIKGRGERRIEFRGIAIGAVVRIYNVHGDLVQTLRQDGSFDGFVPWNLRTKDNLDVAPGLYLFRVEAPGQPGFTGKFAVVK